MDKKAPVILTQQTPFNPGHNFIWLSYIIDDDSWSPVKEETEQLLVERKRKKESNNKLVKRQALICHDSHSAIDVILLSINLFPGKFFSVDTESGHELVCWTGTKLANGALIHQSEHCQCTRTAKNRSDNPFKGNEQNIFDVRSCGKSFGALNEETDPNSPDIPSFEVLEVLLSYGALVSGRVIIGLDCKPRPIYYHLVDRGPDYKHALIHQQ